MQLAGKIMHPT